MNSSNEEVNFVFSIIKLNFLGGSNDKTLFNKLFKFSGVDFKGN